ncbi:ATP-binding protein [Falsiroseomonas sp. HC035]|uniref:ATP-binding protein n=1 Tax=Falsiroseomonas sp. HC035 TaxID=3390999 RepID=UPI003D31E4F9
MTIPPNPEAVARLLDALEGFSEQSALAPKVAHRLTVVLEELAANVAMHGSTGPGAATFVAVAVHHQDDTLVATIEDDGRAFDPLAQAAPDTGAALEDRDVGGLGVHFVRQMTRALDYSRQDGRNRMTAVLDLSG